MLYESDRSMFDLQAAVIKAASYSLVPALAEFTKYQELVVTLDITAAERDSADETYDFYITTEAYGGGQWDLVHFPQVLSIGAKRFVARLLSTRLAEVTTATPGTAAEPSGTFAVITAGAGEGIRTLGAGKVRHGPWGDKIGYELVIAGTVVTGIAYSITIQAR